MSGRWSLHQLHPVTTRRDREGAVGAPELASVLDGEPGVAQPLLGLGVVRRRAGGDRR